MLSALALAAIIAGAQTKPPPPDPEEIASSLAAAAYVIGLCEPSMTPGAAQSILESLSFPDEPDPKARALLADLSAQMYQEGLKDRRRETLTSADCTGLLLQAAEGMGAALASDRANRVAQP